MLPHATIHLVYRKKTQPQQNAKRPLLRSNQLKLLQMLLDLFHLAQLLPQGGVLRPARNHLLPGVSPALLGAQKELGDLLGT